jgi:hypothetical protein
MKLGNLFLVSGVLAGSMVASANIMTTGQTSLDELTFSNDTSSDANARYDIVAGIAGSAGDSTLFGPVSMLRRGYLNFARSGANGVDISGVMLVSGLDYTAIVSTAAVTSAGSFDAGYDTPVATDPSVSWMVSGANGRVDTLNSVDPDGSGVTGSGFGLAVEVLLPVDWSTGGTAAGGHSAARINPAWTIVTNFVYTSGVTKLLATTNAYDGTSNPEMNFALYAEPAPEPVSLALVGGGLGALLSLKTGIRARAV